MIHRFLIPLMIFIGGVSFSQSDPYAETLPGWDGELHMAFIPGGELPDFWMASHEVTWDLYQQFLERRSPDSTDARSGETILLNADAVSGATMPYVDMSLGMGTNPGLPVGNVTRKAAARFCKWLSAKTGHFYRLPTEAEWEHAAQAGSDSPYFFGSDSTALDSYAWFSANSEGKYHQVGEKAPNPYGLYDMYGNVAEWVLDGVDADGTATLPARQEYPGILKGGSYKALAGEVQTEARLLSNPVWKQRDPQFPRSQWWFTDAPFAGFRVVRPLRPPPEDTYHLYWDTK